ncbi:MAG: alpha/beta fold hydrolase [Chloroflexi bacterium]|nr:MAG: alpha/beta fold hydrolase [Chloroflexota bacterium]
MNGFSLEPFRPVRGLRNPHVQTILADVVRSEEGVSFRRMALETPDGDFVLLDFADVNGRSWAELGEKTPIVLALHGLEGSAQRSYMCELYRQLAQRGIRAVGMNFRSCGGVMNRTTTFYHAGATADVALVHEWLQTQFPNVPLGLVGFSLGGNILLKYLGEQGNRLVNRLETAVAISPPFNLALDAQRLERGMGLLYARRLLRKLKQKARQKAPEIAAKVDLERLFRARTLREFDDAWAPLHGFRNAADYYHQCSSGRFLTSICTPTLILRALDDPFFMPDNIPHGEIIANPHICVGLTAHGGHVGFLEGHPHRFQFWAERQAARFVAQILS